MAPLRCAPKFDPTLAQFKERKASNVAIWQPWQRGSLMVASSRILYPVPSTARFQSRNLCPLTESDTMQQACKVYALSKKDCPYGRADLLLTVQGSTSGRTLGFVSFVLARAYHFCLNLTAAFTQPGACLLVEACIKICRLGPGKN